MRVSLEWLREYVDFTLSPDRLAELLSMSGTSVDRVISAGAGVDGVITARVDEVRPHPNADNLLLAMVDDGSAVREIVCGAPNLRAGMRSALAVPGAHLPAVSSRPLKRATIRGVESDGMLVSAAELGMSYEASGIIELEEEVPIGVPVSDVLAVEDTIFDLEITPNRPDCMSVVGIAREVAALTGETLLLPDLELDERGEPIEELVRIEILDPHECPRYSARALTGVKVRQSPIWMQRRLIASGMRPINNLVDVTNYVLMELGQPLHAFDLDLLGQRTIVVRLAGQGEAITTLDGVEHQLDRRTLVIADASKPVAMAGIMGGEDSEVVERTSNVLIESAYFDPTSILLTSKRLGVRTEASSRFERGTDPAGTLFAARRAADLMLKLAGGKMAQGEVDVNPEPFHPVTIDVRPERVNRLLGTGISGGEMKKILEGLEINTVLSEGDGVRYQVPSFRPDLEREIDLVEEVARVYGYGRIPESLPAGGGIQAGLSRAQRLDRRVTGSLAAQGLMEIITYSFMRPSDLDLLGIPPDDPRRREVKLLNPLAETGEDMRTSMLPGMLRAAAGNLNRGNRDLAFFERGRLFLARGRQELPEEPECLGLLLCGARCEPGWSEPMNPVDYFDLKGIVENLALELGVAALSFVPGECPYLAPGMTARVTVGEHDSGLIGQLHPIVAGSFGLEGEFYVGELLLEPLFEAAEVGFEYRPVGRFPNVKVDIALMVNEGLEESAVEGAIVRHGGENLAYVRLFDVYKGPQIPSGKKSLAFALEFGSPDRTLTDEETHREMDRLISAVEKAFGAELRGKRPGAEGAV